MLGVSAEQQAHLPMDSLSWSFFSEHCASPSSNGYSCSDSIFLKSSPVRGMNLSPQSSNAENTGSMFVGRSGMEDSRRELLARSLSLGSSRFNISEFPDTGSVEGLMFDSGYDNFDNASNSNGNGSCLIQKEGRCISVPMSNSFNSATTVVGSPGLNDAIAALQKFLPSNNEDEESWPAVDAYSCDEFRMYEFKVRRCMRGRSHDWTECPFAHPGEKARRRDPRRFHYSGTACPDFRKGSCRRGDACEFAHGVFECWLHPARYRTQPCKDGRNCRRRVCFFAHTPEQLRLLPGASSQNPQSHGVNAAASRSALHASALKNSLSGGSYDGSPLRHGFDGGAGVDGSNPTGYFDGGGSPRGYFAKASHANLCSSLLSSPTSTLVGHSQSPPPLSPPLSPSVSPPLSPDGPGEWSNGSVNYRISSPVKGAYQKALLSPSSLLQVQSSQAAAGNQNLCNISASLASNMLASSPVPAHRRHLDRLGSMPSITIPPPLDARGASSLRSSVLSSSVDASRPSSPGIQSPKVMTELMNSLQKFELNGSSGHAWLQTQAAVAGAHSSPRASNLRRCIHSQPCTPTKSSLVDNWGEGELMEEPVQRVESGRDLRAKIYGRLSKGNLQDSSESPDLGWVNELVK